MKTSELTGAKLDYWVAKAEGINCALKGSTCYASYNERGFSGIEVFSPSTDWSQGGPIQEREQMQITPLVSGGAIARMIRPGYSMQYIEQRGETYLIAICRCFVASRIGNEVPDEETKA